MSDDLMRYGAIAGPVVYSEWIELTPAEVASLNLAHAVTPTERTTMTDLDRTDYGPSYPTHTAPLYDATPDRAVGFTSRWPERPWWIEAGQEQDAARARDQGIAYRTTVNGQTHDVMQTHPASGYEKPFNPPSDDDSGVIYQGSWEALAADGFIELARQQGFGQIRPSA